MHSQGHLEKPSKDDEILTEEAEEFKDSVARHLPASDQRLREILEAQINDAVCSQIRTYVKDGWPSVMPNLPLLKPYWSNAHHLSINNDLLIFDDRLVIPQNMQLDILNKLHAGHLGIIYQIYQMQRPSVQQRVVAFNYLADRSHVQKMPHMCTPSG